VLEMLTADKKVKAGRVRFIMPQKIGAVEITDQVPNDAILAALREMQAI
jgi:3-dehydroquinate synthase